MTPFETHRDAVTIAAGRAGASNPRAVAALARDHLRFDAAGTPVNLEEALAAVQATEPTLFAQAKPGVTMNAFIRDTVRGRRAPLDGTSPEAA
jgi:hypothetical protein